MASLAMALSAGLLHGQVQTAGTLYVDLRATNTTAGSGFWVNQGTLGNFTSVGAPLLVTNVANTGVPGVSFNGAGDAYAGPVSVADIDGGGDRSIEVWAFNPALAQEETTVSWGHRQTTRRNMAFNFGNNATWGAATHWADDVSWGGAPPTAGAWHHLAYTYSNPVVRVYIDGSLANSKTLGGALNTFPDEPINLACQRDSSNGVRSFFYSGYVNTVRIHGGVLDLSQIQNNYLLGPVGASTDPPPAPTGLAATTDTSQIYLTWNTTAGAASYNVKRSTTGGGPYTNVATGVMTTGYLDSGLAPGVTYHYVVSGVNVFGEGPNSSPSSSTTGAPHFLTGLMHRWSFSETNGTLLEDTVASADGQVIVLSGGANYALANGQLRLFGGAKGTSDYAEFPGGLLDGLSNVTVEAWVTPHSAQNWARLFDFGSGSGATAATFFLSLCRGTSLNLQRLEFIPYTVDTGLATTPDQQYHYVVTWGATNGTGGAGRMEWYRDGVLAGGMDTGPTTIAAVDDTVLWLGRSQYPDNNADADFNEVRLYDRLLTPAEINFNRVNGPDDITVAPPQAVDDFMTMNAGSMALIPVVKNDVGTALDPDSVTMVSAPAAGTAQAKPNGRILYTHNGGPAMSDQFTYRVQNLMGATSGVATVAITISPSLRLENTTLTVPDVAPPASYQVVDAFPTNLFFEDAVALRSPPGSSNQLFVVERRGMISYVPDVTATNPVRLVFLDISDQVRFDGTTQGEMGLLSMDFHPGFASNGLFFVSYMTPPVPTTPFFDRVARFTANPGLLTVDTNTQQVLFSVQDQAFNHNGSDLHFGPDGYLYISMGDEGDQYNFRQNAQRIDKDFYSGLLRIDVDKRPGSIEPTAHTAIPTDGSGHAFYSIPPDNPFVGATNFYGQPINTSALRAEFWAVGFRHPWRFSIDTNGEVWVGDVGQDRYEEVDVATSGGNYGWAYYEGDHLARDLYPNQTALQTNPPPGLTFPIWEYVHTSVAGGDPQYKGNSISGGVVYHGLRIPEFNGWYIFGDFESANLWALVRTNSSAIVQRIAGDSGMAGFGVDPSNGDVLIANYLQNKVKRLVRTATPDSGFPAKLSDTGIFADPATLAPNPGIVSYDPIVAFWSDHASKRRWFTIPDLTNQVTFAVDGNWSFPAGMKWIKHFDLETERGNPATKLRLETRVLVKTAAGSFGVSYRWNDAQDEAFLVADGGTNFFVTVQDGTNTFQQQWEIPSRAACLVCHTPAGGHALSFNTRELNQDTNMNGFAGNQIELLSQAGYFTAPVGNVHTLPAFARATDADFSLEYRVRSYLSENCVQCHQAGGPGASSWDARPHLTLDQTRLINGLLENNGSDPLNKLVVPGDTNHSVLLRRIAGDGFSRMPPLATHELDQGAIDLVTAWITTELTNRLDFSQWQVVHFGSTNDPLAAAAVDPDQDGANNYFEWLTRTDPQNLADSWRLGIGAGGGLVDVSYPLVPNLGVVIETSTNLFGWSPWNVPGNQPFFSSSAGTVVLQGALSPGQAQFFRARLLPP